MFLYIFIKHLTDPQYFSIFGWLNLGIHEVGHLVFYFFGEFISIAGGTILQCIVPVISIFMFYRQKDFFAIAVCFGWLSTNFFHVGTYVADARSMNLPLHGFTANPIHDWNYLLSKLNILEFDTSIAFIFNALAFLSMLICLIFGGWLLWKMLSLRSPKT